MFFLCKRKQFIEDESGAVTVDWVVLTAMTVGLAIAVVTLVADGMTSHAGTVEDSLAHMAEDFANGYDLHP